MEITPVGPSKRMLDDTVAAAHTAGQHWWRADLHAINTVDTTLNSLTFGLFANSSGSLFSEEGSSLQEAKPVSDIVGGIASIAAGVGLGTKAVQYGGAMSRLASSTGLSDDTVRLLFANRDRIETYDAMMAAARNSMAGNYGRFTGFTTPNLLQKGHLGAGAEKLRAVTGATTYEDAAKWAAKTRLANGFKEGIAQELAIFAIANQNDFLFPDNLGVGQYLAFGGLGVGLNMGIEHILGRKAMSHSLKTAAKFGREQAEAARRAGMFSEATAMKGSELEHWQMGSAGLYGLHRLAALEMAADSIAKASGGALSRDVILQEIQTARLAIDSTGMTTAKNIARTEAPEPVLANGLGKTPGLRRKVPVQNGSDGVVETTWARAKANPEIMVGLRHTYGIGDDVGQRYLDLVDKADDDLFNAKKLLNEAQAANDPKAIAAAYDAVNAATANRNQLDQVRVGTIEPGGNVNWNENRLAPFYETPRGNGKLTSDPVTSAVHIDGDIALRPDGSVAHRGNMMLIDGQPLTPRQMTESYTLVAKAAANEKWAREFFGNFFADPRRSYADLPIAIVDALASGALKIDLSAPLPKAQKLAQDIADGTLQLQAVSRKLDWYKAQLSSPQPLDWFDLEKVLNLRLTNEIGQPNNLARAFEAWGETAPQYKAAELLGDKPGWNLGAASLADHVSSTLGSLGRAYHGLPASQMMAQWEDDLTTGMAGGIMLKAHKQPGGIPAVYHAMPTMRHGEIAAAQFAALRKASHTNAIANSPSLFVRSLWAETTADPIQMQAAGNVAEIFVDSTRTRNPVLAQRQFQEREQNPLMAAAHIGTKIKNATDRMVSDLVKPIVEAKNALFKSKTFGESIGGIANAHHLVSRGVALADDAYVVGVNAIDVSRPGAKHLLETLGPLQGAPAKLEDWVMFDIAIAANEARYVPLNLSQEAADFLNMVRGVDQEWHTAMNSLRSAAGLPPIGYLKGHLPQSNFNRFEIRYITDGSNGVVGYVKGRTAQEADAELARAIERADRNAAVQGTPVAHHEMPVTMVQNYYDAVDNVFLNNLRDMSGIKQTGTSGGRNLNFALDISGDTLDDMIVALRNTGTDLGKRTVAATFAGPMAEAQMMLARAGQDRGFFNSVENWKNFLLAESKLPENSVVKQIHNTFESWANSAIGAVAAHTPTPIALGIRRLNSPGGLPADQERLFQKFAAEHQPFNHLINDPNWREYVKVERSTDPYRLASQLQALNKGTTEVFLKLANVAHPLLNLAGTMVTSPAVLRAMQPLKGETPDAYAARVGYLADYLDVAKMQANLSAPKIMTEGLEYVMRDSAALAEASRLGYIGANMLEELNKLNNIRPTRFTEALDFLRKYTDFLNLWLTPLQKKITGQEPSAFTLSERSETFVRAWTHMQGYALINKIGRAGLSEESKHAFAHQISNMNIADFSPHLRGSAFRGVAGIPFGLFQSYSINLYQRMFGYVENKMHRALATQMATQAGMFGVGGLPGWNQLNALYFNTSRDTKADEYGATTLNERLYTRLGKTQADILMTGGLSSLPRLLGGENINLYSSGDMNVREPGMPPGVAFATQMVQGGYELLKRSGEEIGAAFGPEPADPMRVVEVLAHYAPSRGHRSLVDLFLGERMDRNGNLLVEDTRSGTALVSRLLGTRTHNEIMVQQAAWSNSNANGQRVRDMQRVRNRILRHVRAGSIAEDAGSQWLAEYLGAGGNPDTFDRWMKYTTDKSLSTRDKVLLDRLTTGAGEILGHNFAAVQRVGAAVGPEGLAAGAMPASSKSGPIPPQQ